MLCAIAKARPVPDNLIVRNGSKNPRHACLGNRAAAALHVNPNPIVLAAARNRTPAASVVPFEPDCRALCGAAVEGGGVLKCLPPGMLLSRGPEHPETRGVAVRNL